MTDKNYRDLSNSLDKYIEYTHKGTNIVLNGANSINKWYAEQLKKIVEKDIPISRIETGVDDTKELENSNENKNNKINTKVKQYNELQTNNRKEIIKVNKIQTVSKDSLKDVIGNDEVNKRISIIDKKIKITKRISTIIKGTKLISNSAQKFTRTGKTISTGLNENGATTFRGTSSRIMTKPIQKASEKIAGKITKETVKYSKKMSKRIGNKIKEKTDKRIISKATNGVVKVIKLVGRLIMDTMKFILSLLPQIAPIMIIVIIIVAIGEFLNLEKIDDADGVNFNDLSELMIVIDDEDLQAIYNEFLKNMGTPYLMDHSNLKYDECMEYYDCSSWVIHCLAHTGIKTLPNTDAQGIYNNFCFPIDVEDRKAGDLIFLKGTYDNGDPERISHIGIYMEILEINGQVEEWVIDTGGNPSGVRIRKYDNGWWNGSNFYGFGRLK